MSGAETLAPGLVLLGLFLIFLPVMSAEQNWARGLVVGIAGVVMLRYLVWRLDETVLPLDFDSAQGIWILMVFVIEALAFADTALSFFMMSRYANRSVEADRHEARLRAMPDDRLRSVDVFFDQFSHGYFGVATLEALACGVPTCLRLSLEGTEGIDLPPVFNVSTEDDIVRAMHACRREDTRAAMRRASREWAVARHDWRVVMEWYLELYRGVPRRRRPLDASACA